MSPKYRTIGYRNKEKNYRCSALLITFSPTQGNESREKPKKEEEERKEEDRKEEEEEEEEEGEEEGERQRRHGFRGGLFTIEELLR
jgi:hypothetical protein